MYIYIKLCFIYKIYRHQSNINVKKRTRKNKNINKPGPRANGAVDLSGESGQGVRSGLHDIIRPTPPLSQSPSHDTVFHYQDSHTSPSHTPCSPIGSSHPYNAMSSALTSQDPNLNGMSSSSTPTSPDSSLPLTIPAPPSDPALGELEAIKENKCSVVGPLRVEGPVSQSEEPKRVEGIFEDAKRELGDKYDL